VTGTGKAAENLVVSGDAAARERGHLRRGYRESLAERKGLGIDSRFMKTAPLVVTIVAAVVLPALLSSLGCNKKEDPVPMPGATTAVAVPTQATAAPTVTAPIAPPTNTVPLLRTTPLIHGDAGVRSDAAVVVARADAASAATIGLPPGLPTIALPPASAIPGIASSIVGGIMGALPPPILPTPPPAPTK
jgi:hypothetical protein